MYTLGEVASHVLVLDMIPTTMGSPAITWTNGDPSSKWQAVPTSSVNVNKLYTIIFLEGGGGYIQKLIFLFPSKMLRYIFANLRGVGVVVDTFTPPPVVAPVVNN